MFVFLYKVLETLNKRPVVCKGKFSSLHHYSRRYAASAAADCVNKIVWRAYWVTNSRQIQTSATCVPPNNTFHQFRNRFHTSIKRCMHVWRNYTNFCNMFHIHRKHSTMRSIFAHIEWVVLSGIYMSFNFKLACNLWMKQEVHQQQRTCMNMLHHVWRQFQIFSYTRTNHIYSNACVCVERNCLQI